MIMKEESGPRRVIQFPGDHFEMVESRVLAAPRRPGAAGCSCDAIVAGVERYGHAYSGLIWSYRDLPCAVPRTPTKQLFIGLACTSYNQHANVSPLCLYITLAQSCGFVSCELYVKPYFTVATEQETLF